jgi:predicted nucleotide-binding protein
MWWKRGSIGDQDVGPIYRPGAAKLLQISIERVEDAETVDELETILAHTFEGVFVSAKRCADYTNLYVDKMQDTETVDDDIRLLVTVFRTLLDQIETSTPATVTEPTRRSGRVFVVHGHDLNLRDRVCAILESFELVPVVLADTAGSSQTIIELVELHGHVDHAICLLTADDVGGSKTGSHRPRARQNVVWEVGYFFGLLGRKRVSMIADDGLELPSNIVGLRPIVLNEGVNLKDRLRADLVLAGTLRN